VYQAQCYGELGFGELPSKWPLNLLKMKSHGITRDLEFPTFHDLSLGSTQYLEKKKSSRCFVNLMTLRLFVPLATPWLSYKILLPQI
jgi:hypothetical protein